MIFHIHANFQNGSRKVFLLMQNFSGRVKSEKKIFRLMQTFRNLPYADFRSYAGVSLLMQAFKR